VSPARGEGGPEGVRETALVLDEPAEAAIAGAADFLRRRGVRLTLETPYSVAFADGRGAPGAPAGGGPERGAGQVAAVPVQLKPEWCRVWVTVSGGGPAGEAADAYVAEHRERAAHAGAAVRELERAIFRDSRWPSYAESLRASLSRQGLEEGAIEERVARFRQRWEALGRKAAREAEE
jgi:hypothetical protein